MEEIFWKYLSAYNSSITILRIGHRWEETSNLFLQTRLATNHYSHCWYVWIALCVCASLYSCPVCFIVRCPATASSSATTRFKLSLGFDESCRTRCNALQDWCFRCLMACVVAIIIRLRACCVLSFTQIYPTVFTRSTFHINIALIVEFSFAYVSYVYKSCILSTLVRYHSDTS